LAFEQPGVSTVIGKLGYSLGIGQPAAKTKIDYLGPYPPKYFAAPWFLSINKKSTKAAAAWQLVKFIAANAKTQLQLAASYANTPTMLSVFNSQEYQSKDPAATAIAQVLKVGTVEVAPVRQSTAIYQAILHNLQNLLSLSKDPKAVATSLYDDVGSALKR
jgi:ABC-type glycerol-3-phosphate transport system substrate-binding protein